MSYSPNQRATIDQEVYKWVMQQKEKDKIVTANTIRQKAFELGQEFDPNFKASLNWYNNWKKRYDYNETPEAEALKHKKRHYTAAFKLHAVRRAAEMESASQAALELDVSRRCLQRWTEELDLITSVAEHSSNAVYRRPGQGRKVFDTTLDKQLLDWLKESWQKGENVSALMIREKARELSQKPGFKASLGWYIKWQKRHGIDLKIQSCNPPTEDKISPLKLRLLQDGEVYTYTPGMPSAKRRKISKKKLSYDDEALLENDEEFDRQLLTWLVERWEAGDIVTDRMVKDKAAELSTNSEFKPTKMWLSAWKRKYNISLENQTYGNEGEEEAEEIVEESEIYDNEVLLEEQQAGSSKDTGGRNLKHDSENPLTPTKEEAATVLASLSAEDHEAAGLEIAEALQKLANAFGIVQGGGDAAKEAMVQLTAAYQANNPEFILGGGEGQVGMEEVISEEVITDEPMVVIETGVAESMEGDVTQATSVPIIREANIVSTTSHTTVSSNANNPTPISVTSQALSSSHLATSYVTEEVVVSDPNSGSGGTVDDSQVQVVVQEQGPSDMVIEEEVIQDMADPSGSAEVAGVSIDASTVALAGDLSATQELLDMVQESIAGIVGSSGLKAEGKGEESRKGDDPLAAQRTYDTDFKNKVVERAVELGSVQQAALEFSVPWKVVMNWKTNQNKTDDVALLAEGQTSN